MRLGSFGAVQIAYNKPYHVKSIFNDLEKKVREFPAEKIEAVSLVLTLFSLIQIGLEGWEI